MNIHEHLKNYRKYKDLIKYYERKMMDEMARGTVSLDDLHTHGHYKDLVEAIEHTIASVPDPDEQLLLRFRYVEGYGWTKIGFTMHYSNSQLKRIHRRALKRLEGVVLE